MTMRLFLGVMCLSIAAACGGGADHPEAAALYRTAWEKKATGDRKGHEATLKEVADKHPRTRAGQRAKQVLATPGAGPGVSMSSYLLGAAAAIAIPTFMKSRADLPPGEGADRGPAR
jgi:hypothetical protein